MGQATAIAPLALGLALASVSAGCGLTSNQTKALSAFGRGTTAFGTSVESVAPKAAESIDRLREGMITYPTNASRKAFDSASGDLPAYIRNPDEHKHVDLVVALADAVSQYGQALLDLAAYGDSDTRMQKVSDVASSLDSIFRDPVASATASAAGKTLGFAASQVLDAIKKKDVKAIVRAADPQIKAAGTLLQAEFEGKAPGTLFFAYEQEIKTYSDRTTFDPGEADRPLVPARGTAGTVCAQPEYEYRRQVVAAQHTLARHRATVAAIQGAALTATNKLIAAEDQLVKTIENDTTSWQDITDFVSATSKLYAAFKSNE